MYFLKNIKFYHIIVLYLLMVFAISLQLQLLTYDRQSKEPNPYTEYNNYVIFKQSHVHLLDGYDLYRIFEMDQWDLYKYSPTFALFFGLFAYFPDYLGMVLWNLLNALILLWAIKSLPELDKKQKILFGLLALVELNTNLHNAQANALMAGLMMLFWIKMEKGQGFWAAMFLIFSVYIKLFSVVAVVMILFYPQFWRNAAYFVFWFLVFMFSPALVIGVDELFLQYENWYTILKQDSGYRAGLSLHMILVNVFGVQFKTFYTLLFGVVLFNIALLMGWLWKHKEFYWRAIFISQAMVGA